MDRTRALSAQARIVLRALVEAGGEWCHGYDLVRSTGLKSGTLYPLLIRLEARGYLDAEWQPPVAPGRPPRHAYRLSASGLRLARESATGQNSAPLTGRPVRT